MPPTFPAGSYPARVVASGASHYWRLDEKSGTVATDVIGGANGTISGGVTLGQPGALADGSTAMRFDGATGRILTSPISLPGIFSLELWFKVGPDGNWCWGTTGGPVSPTTDVLASLSVNTSSGSSTNYNGYLQYAAGGEGGIAVNFLPYVGDGQSHHLVWIFPGGVAAELYIDGAKQGTATLLAPLVGIAGRAFDIGHGGMFSQWWNGGLDELALYPRALTASEILAHYQARLVAPWALHPGDKALMYAIGKIARGGATRGAYVSQLPIIGIGGDWTGTPDASRRVLVSSLAIQDLLNETPNTCTLTVQGTRPSEGSEIIIGKGSRASGVRLFAGTILRVEELVAVQNPTNPKNLLFNCEGIDYTWGLNAVLVSARYRSASATAIALDLLARFAPPGGYTAKVADGLPQVDEITFTNTPLMECLAQLAGRIGGYAKCDYFRRVWLWTTLDPLEVPPPRALTPDHPSLESISYTRDLSPVITRALVEGGGVNAIEQCDPGETRIPVEDSAWYSEAGGFVVSGPQRLRYGGVVVSGGGAMLSAVGGATGNTSPPSGPQIGTSAGAGLPPGNYKYAYTWTTVQGETLPSPTNVFNPGGAGGPGGALTAAAIAGSGLKEGRYRYAYTFATASGETVPGPTAEIVTQVTTQIPPPGTMPTLRLSSPGSLVPGNYAYTYTFVNSVGETTGSTMARSIMVPAGGWGVIMEGIPPGPPGTIGRNIYRTWMGAASAYFLVGWLTDNTRTSWGPDNKTDGELGVPIPSTNTTGASFCQGALSAIASGPAGTTARKVYRTAVGGTALKLLTTLANNTATTFTDNKADSTLGAAPPSTGTVSLARAVVSAISTGPQGTNTRKIYRTPVNSTALKLLTTITDNTATAIAPDATPDASLGAAVPQYDTSGLVSGGAGQVNAGSPTIPVASPDPFQPEGWALVGGQLVRYHGVTAIAITGIPATGIGSLGVSIPYNSPIKVMSQLTGVPASGPGSIVETILPGDPVNLLVVLDDPEAQAILAALLGGGTASGVIEYYDQDRRISLVEAEARAEAWLALRSRALETIRYRVRDPRSQSAATVDVDLPPLGLVGTFQIQDVQIGGFMGVPHVPPLYDVVASSRRFTFEDLLRRFRRADSGGP